MPRTENDTWDLASSVGATATGVAASRALASLGPDPLIDDVFAEPLVRAVGVDYFIKMARTKYFDDSSPRRPTPASARPSSWQPVSTPAPTACAGRRERRSSRWTSHR
jgi:O-methyltransferase involved in polyketide biosynthesis